ncbi:unnamed protein product [Rhodiola kirilowii]
MAGRANIPTNNSALIAMIADEDTVTGFLLAGVGNVDLRRKTNYLIVMGVQMLHLQPIKTCHVRHYSWHMHVTCPSPHAFEVVPCGCLDESHPTDEIYVTCNIIRECNT